MIKVDDWITEYDDLVVSEMLVHEGYSMSDEKIERLKSMRFKLKSILWGCNLN